MLFKFQKTILVMDKLNIIKMGKWGCRLRIQEKYKTRNRLRGELKRHVAKPRGLDEMTLKEWWEIKAPQEG